MNAINVKPQQEISQSRIDKSFVHKWKSENVLIGEISRRKDFFSCPLIVDTSHSFFFEHPQDHVPGMMVIESARQFLTALAHVHGNVPLSGYKMILNYMDARFNHYLELDSDTLMHASLTEIITSEDGIWSSFTGQIHFIQGENEAAFMQVEATVMAARAYERMRRWSKKKLAEQVKKDLVSNG